VENSENRSGPGCFTSTVKNKKVSKKPKSVEKSNLKIALHLVHSNCFYKKNVSFLYHPVKGIQCQKIKTDELGINGSIS
jgi:hypothetical protein